MQQSTVIIANPGVVAMKAMALALFPSMQWRHHGIGVLQGYVVENVEPEIRLHIWARELIKPGIDLSGDIHDHRFDLVSHVLTGVVGHEETIPEEDDAGDWTMLELTHARAAKDNAYHGPTKPLGGRFVVRRNLFVIPAGSSYHFPAGHFHRSPLVGNGVTVTVVEKHHQSPMSARVLHPVTQPPVMAFGHEMDLTIVGTVLAHARESLEFPAVSIE